MKLKKNIILCLIALISIEVGAQTTIQGKVVGRNGKAIKGASVFLPETYEGGETDDKGIFSFSTAEKGEFVVVANHINYYADTIKVNIGKEQTPLDNLNFILRPQMSVMIDEVVVSSVSSMAVSESKAKEALSTMDVYTTPTGNADMALALRTTPGLQDVGNQEGFFIRGGADNETGVVIDGVRVKNFFPKGAPNVTSRSRMEAGMFKGMILGTGGYSPQYGDALSGILELNTKDMPTQSSFSFGFSPLFVSAQADVFGFKRKSYTEAVYAYSNVAAVKPFLRKGWGFSPTTYSHALKLRNVSKVSSQGELRFTLFADLLSGGIFKNSVEEDDSDFRFHNRENYLLSTLNYRHYLGSNMTLTLIGGYSRNENKSRIENKIFVEGKDTKTVDNYKQAGVNLKYKKGRFSSVQGIEYNNSLLNFNDKRFEDTNWSAFFNAMQQLSSKWLLTVGLRGEYSTFLQKGIALPRVSLTHTITKNHTLTIDGGMYSQMANYFLPTRTSDGGYLPTGREQSEQYNLTYQILPRSGNYVLRFQMFNKNYRNLTLIQNDAPLVNNGRGYARGLDFFFMDSKSLRGFKYRVSYSYINSKRDFLYYPVMVQPSFVANHTASLVIQKYVNKISSQFNLSFSFRSGFPYYNPNLGYDKFMSERTSSLFNMDFSYNKLFSFKSVSGVAILSITNILGSNSALTYQFSQTPNSEGKYKRSAVISPTYPFVFVGVFLNIGTDKRKEIIDNYL